ncbi:MAG: hypothetical protein ACFHU9_11730 [Fluviicola sp.]
MLFKRIQSFLLALSWLALLVVKYCDIQHIIESRLPVRLVYITVGGLYFVRYWNKEMIRYTDTIKCVLIVVWCALETSFTFGVRFDPVVLYSFILLGALWFFLETIDLFKGRTKGPRLILLLGGLLLGAQLTFRVFAIPFAAVLMILGYVVIAIGFVAELIVLSSRK